MCYGSLLEFLKEGQGQHSKLVDQIDMAAQVSSSWVILIDMENNLLLF